MLLELLSIERAGQTTRYSVVVSIVLLTIVSVIPFSLWSALLRVGLICAISVLIFQGTTLISLRLKGSKRIVFQVSMAIFAPCMLSLYFIQNVSNISNSNSWGFVFDYPFLPLASVLGILSWGLCALLHREYPVRGFLIACVILFILTWFGFEDVPFNYDYEEIGEDIDEASHLEAVQKGKYFWQFLAYVVVTYVGLFAKYLHRKLRPDSYLF